ncbi:GPI inositol-deacylase isoform X2 [Denticeps clupeoides]|uniref:GPI inositol-deacylase isoform X2 n=1 Tax=Denticeps clupeoides TaxID=299321 RepID=UPI0010A2C7B7|nr:GPI inositol-deacylase isoform X2 [Denticeps clupeoides]
MSPAAAFFGCALGLLAVGLKEVFLGFEENRCSMTYMFEYPEYRRIPLPRRVSRLYPAYGLYLYGEGSYAQETRSLKLSGAPVLFLPGNAGSYKQARSLGSVALRKAEGMDGGVHLNVFTVDFNEELVALYGGSLRRQTLFLHECIKAVLRLYKHRPDPPKGVVLVGHSMGGVVARALFTLPRFNPALVNLILTQASPHQAPVLPLDPHILDFYSAVRQRWITGAEDLRNVTVLSVGGGYRDYQVRSGLTVLPCPITDPNKLSLVVTAVPRTWVSTDHLSIVWCKELVLATVRSFFDLINPETGQFTDGHENQLKVLGHHFIRHPVQLPGVYAESPVIFTSSPEAWSEVNTLRLFYSAPKDGQVKYFLFALSSRRKAYSHFHCRSSSMEMSSWVYGCTEMNASVCVQAMDLSQGTELLPTYKTLTLRTSQLSFMSHLVVAASPSSRQFTVECEWQREETQIISVAVPHLLSFGLTVSDVTINSSGLLHTVQFQHFHQVYQAFRITVVSHCKTKKERLPSVYRLKVPWFREDTFTTASIPSVAEISGMLHTSHPGNTSSALLLLHTAPNCQYKISVRTSIPKVLGQVLRFCGPVLPVYTAVTILLALARQLSSVKKMGRPTLMGEALGGALQPHKVELPVYLLHLLLRQSWFQETWVFLGLPAVDALPIVSPENLTHDTLVPPEDWPRLLSPLLFVLGATVAFWGSTLMRLSLSFLSFLLAPLHRPCVSRDCGTLLLQTQILFILIIGIMGGATCGALLVTACFFLHVYRVLRLQMAERTLSHMLNLAPEKALRETENGHSDPHCPVKTCNSAPLLSESALHDVRDDLQLHLSLLAVLTLPMMLCSPSLIHWARNLRHSVHLDPDPCWPHTLPLLFISVRLNGCSTHMLQRSFRPAGGFLSPLTSVKTLVGLTPHFLDWTQSRWP